MASICIFDSGILEPALVKSLVEGKDPGKGLEKGQLEDESQEQERRIEEKVEFALCVKEAVVVTGRITVGVTTPSGSAS